MNRFNRLIETIYRSGCYIEEGGQAIEELISSGEPALDAFLGVRKHPPASDQHPRDLADSLSVVLQDFAKHIPDAIINRFEAGQLGDFETYWALGSATDKRSVEVLIGGLKSKEKYSRWAAAEALVRRRSKKGVPALIEALKDRSTDVKSSVVFGMRAWSDLRRPEAAPALERVVANKAIRKHSPGLHKAAEDVIRLIENEVK